MFESGESVRIIDDMAEVMKLQSGHGGWNDDMGCVRPSSQYDTRACITLHCLSVDTRCDTKQR